MKWDEDDIAIKEVIQRLKTAERATVPRFEDVLAASATAKPSRRVSKQSIRFCGAAAAIVVAIAGLSMWGSVDPSSLTSEREQRSITATDDGSRTVETRHMDDLDFEDAHVSIDRYFSDFESITALELSDWSSDTDFLLTINFRNTLQE